MDYENNFEEVNYEAHEVVTEEVINTPAPATEEKHEMSLGEAVINLTMTVATGVGLVTIGKKVFGGAKKLFGKIRGKGKKDDTCEGNCEECCCCVEPEEDE